MHQHGMLPIFRQGEKPGINQGEIQQGQQYLAKNPLHGGQSGTEPYRRIDRDIENLGIVGREMLPRENLHRLVKDIDVVQTPLLRALPLVVDDARLREVVVLVAALQDPVRQVDVLAVHEIVLIQKPHLVEHRPTHHHEGAAEDLHLVGLVLADVRGVVGPEFLRFREEFRETEELVERRRRVWDAALRLGEETALSIDHLHAEAAAIGGLVHETDALLERVFLHEGIRVEQQHIFAGGDADSLVVGSRESHIILILNKVYLRELGLHHCHGIIHRMVIDHINLPLDTAHSLQRRRERLLQKRRNVVIDYDDA